MYIVTQFFGSTPDRMARKLTRGVVPTCVGPPEGGRTGSSRILEWGAPAVILPFRQATRLWVRAEECISGEHGHQAIGRSSLGRARVRRLDLGSLGSGGRSITG